jgi:hypothetical protein
MGNILQLFNYDNTKSEIVNKIVSNTEPINEILDTIEDNEKMQYVMESNSNARFLLGDLYYYCEKGKIMPHMPLEYLDVQCDPEYIQTCDKETKQKAMCKLRFLVNCVVDNAVVFYQMDRYYVTPHVEE